MVLFIFGKNKDGKMKKFEEYISEASANKQITVNLDTDKRELTFMLRGLFPPALITAVSKSLRGKQFRVDKDELKIYI
jgi:hypothetical protein